MQHDKQDLHYPFIYLLLIPVPCRAERFVYAVDFVWCVFCCLDEVSPLLGRVEKCQSLGRGLMQMQDQHGQVLPCGSWCWEISWSQNWGETKRRSTVHYSNVSWFCPSHLVILAGFILLKAYGTETCNTSYLNPWRELQKGFWLVILCFVVLSTVQYHVSLPISSLVGGFQSRPCSTTFRLFSDGQLNHQSDDISLSRLNHTNHQLWQDVITNGSTQVALWRPTAGCGGCL